MKKIILFVSLAVAGLMTSCVDKYEEVPADSNPSFLGGSIWEELESGEKLTGTFDTYMRLAEDLGYKDVLNKTGSKTIFPANDDAFKRFFESNEYGVSSYEELTDAQKKQLFYSSMLDNAILVSMLANVSNSGGGVTTGMAMKHETASGDYDTLTYAVRADQMPANNSYWDDYVGKGIYYVSDASTPMMVHFVREQMVNNDITTKSTDGNPSDFEILTGVPYDEDTNPAFVFKDQIINRDITCLNGYIHQLEDVLVPPGNMADVVRKNSNTSYFSRFLDYYCAPYENSELTSNYNDYATAQGLSTIDKIYEKKYFSARSEGSTARNSVANTTDPNGTIISSNSYLDYDPGWNQYFPSAGNNSSTDRSLMDIGAMFVPEDEAVEESFLPGGDLSFIIDLYGAGTGQGNEAVNTKAMLKENLDSVFAKKPDIITKILKNLMMSSFISTVPSKFSTITNDASENMGMKVSLLKKNTDDNTYDVRVACNGVVYVLNTFIAPDAFSAVLAPASFYSNMRVMNWCISEADPQSNGATQYLGLSFDSYLLSMQARYLFFIPTDEAFEQFYIDPTSLGKSQPLALKFYYDSNAKNAGKRLACDRYQYDPSTNTIGNKIETVSSVTDVKSQLVDILNYHTVVLGSDTLFENNYYKTKHGGEIYAPGLGDDVNATNYTVQSGGQINNGLETSKVTTVYNQKNGTAYAIDHVIQPTTNSVYKTLSENSQFSEFLALCQGFDDNDLLSWAGLSDALNEFNTTEQTPYIVFSSTYGTGDNAIQQACLDYNVRFFNTYNYTLYAPNNEAMEKAYAAGLPRWSDLYAKFEELGEEATEADKAEVLEQINLLRRFVRYHFQSTSVYADNVVESQQYQTMFSDAMGVPMKIDIEDVSGQMAYNVIDEAGVTHNISVNSGLMTNRMARDYWFNAGRTRATSITTSSFCVIHELSEPLYCTTDKRFD